MNTVLAVTPAAPGSSSTSPVATRQHAQVARKERSNGEQLLHPKSALHQRLCSSCPRLVNGASAKLKTPGGFRRDFLQARMVSQKAAAKEREGRPERSPKNSTPAKDKEREKGRKKSSGSGRADPTGASTAGGGEQKMMKNTELGFTSAGTTSSDNCESSDDDDSGRSAKMKSNFKPTNPAVLPTLSFFSRINSSNNDLRALELEEDQDQVTGGERASSPPSSDGGCGSAAVTSVVPNEGSKPQAEQQQLKKVEQGYLNVVPTWYRHSFEENAPAIPGGSSNATTLIQRLTKEFLTSGGDDRLLLDKNKVNKYQTPAYPEPRGIHRSSCTSNCVTDYTFHTVGEPLVQKLLKDVSDEFYSEGRRTYTHEIDSIRDAIRNVWHLPRVGNSITLCPSGSDAEYLPLLLAICRVLHGAGDDVGSGILTIVTGAGEVGSGTLNAAKGKFFSNVSPKESVSVGFSTSTSTAPSTTAAAKANSVKNGDPVFQLPKDFPPIEAVEVYMRNNAGGLKSALEVDQEVKDVVRMALQEQGFKQVVVHVVAGSKTGHLIPSVTVLDELVAEFGEKSIVPVIDACQGRLQEGALKQYLEKNYIVLTTGSKFYGGPPFSGAVLLPVKLSSELDSEYEHIWKKNNLLDQFPLFMDDVLLSHDLPKMRGFIHEVSTKEKNWHHRLNWGVVLRWKMALNEIRLYHSIPEKTRDAILTRRDQAAWVKSTKQIVGDLQSPFVACCEDEFRAAVTDIDVAGSRRATEEEAGMFLTNTIVSLVCRVPVGDASKNQTRRLNINDLKILHKLMSQDLSGGKIAGLDETAKTESYKLPGPYGSHVVETIGDVLSTKCYIAQPVQVQPGSLKNALTVIRVTIGAPLVHWVWEKMKRVSISDTNSLQKMINLTAQSDLILFLKMRLLLEHWDQVAKK